MHYIYPCILLQNVLQTVLQASPNLNGRGVDGGNQFCLFDAERGKGGVVFPLPLVRHWSSSEYCGGLGQC